MKLINWKHMLAARAVVAFATMLTATAADQPARTAWFEEARFGLFIHWSACSALEGRYCGEPVRQGWYGEWLRARNRVPRADWDKGIRQMQITPARVDAWAEAAKQAGMKYVIFVAKHHDGLAFWPSKVSDYTYNRLSGVSFDVIGRLKKACDARGLKLCFYYSQWQDWEDPDGWGNFWEFNSKDPKQFEGRDNLQFWDGSLFRDNLTSEGFDRYWRRKSMPQVEELIRNYHPAIMWFDCYIPRKATVMTDTQLGDMLAHDPQARPAVPRQFTPAHRLALAATTAPTTRRWATTNSPTSGSAIRGKVQSPFHWSWGYNRDDQNWRPTTYFVRNLVRNTSLGGNLVINIGPLADGTVPEEALVRMKEIGRCLAANREGITGCGFTPFEERTQDWGLTTTRRAPDGSHQLFLHVFDWPIDSIVRVNGLKTKVRAARLSANRPFARLQATGHLDPR